MKRFIDVSHTVCAYVEGPKKFDGYAEAPPLGTGTWLKPQKYINLLHTFAIIPNFVGVG